MILQKSAAKNQRLELELGVGKIVTNVFVPFQGVNKAFYLLAVSVTHFQFFLSDEFDIG